jgi:cell division protein FtsB
MARTLEEAERQLAQLIEENRRLATELEGLQSSGPALEKAAKDAVAARRTAEAERAALKTQFDGAQRQVAELTKTNQTLSAAVKRLDAQVQKTPLNPLTVEEATQMFERVVAPFNSSPTLEVRSVSLNLKLATAKLGDQAVLVVPDPVNANPALLHEIRLDLISKPLEVAQPVRPVTPPRPVGPVVPPIVRAPVKAPAKKTAKAAAKKTRPK